MSVITPEQRERLLAAYDEFSHKAKDEEKEEVDALLRQASVRFSASPGVPGAPAGFMDLTLQTEADGSPRAIPPELEHAADCPEAMYLWEALEGDPSSETAELLARFEHAAEERPEVLPTTREGALLGTGRYQVLDRRWTEAGIDWLKNVFNRAEFRRDPRVVRIPNSARLVLVGDWGTGVFRDETPAERVATQIRALDPDLTIHLGDVYYAGRRREVRDHFLAHWPAGRQGSMALNANHEMYTGGFGYFEDLLGDSRFEAQNGTSYFALENDHWVIVGLDSAYHANRFKLYRIGRLDDDQMAFLGRMAARAEGKRLVVLSHHQGLNLDASVCEPLWSQVRDGLGGRPAVWYWGHLHAGAVFAPIEGIQGRCCGYGGIPRAQSEILEGNDQVLYFENRLADDPELPQRVVNGFALLDLEGPVLEEKLIDELGRELWSHRPIR